MKKISCPMPKCSQRGIQLNEDEVCCYICGWPRPEAPAPASLDDDTGEFLLIPDGDDPKSFVYGDYTVDWYDYKPSAYRNGELMGEWVARHSNKAVAIRLAAYVNANAGVPTQTAEKLKVLRNLLERIGC